jgi:hypothetical protein
MSLMTRTPLALEIRHRDLTNRVCSDVVWGDTADRFLADTPGGPPGAVE